MTLQSSNPLPRIPPLDHNYNMPHVSHILQPSLGGYSTDSSSYTQSSSLVDLDFDHDRTPTKMTTQFNLHASIATLPEPRLRAMMINLVDNNPEIERLIAQELLVQPRILSNSRSPEGRMKRHKVRRGSSAKAEKCVTCGLRPKPAGRNGLVRQEECRYHPGVYGPVLIVTFLTSGQ